MKKIEIECWEVLQADGCGVSSDHYAYCATKALAEEIAEPANGWRSVQPYKKIIVVFESLAEYDDSRKQALRQSALDKLTPEEMQALGIK